MSISKDDSLFNTKTIYDLTKFTHLDFENHLSCIVWFGGCNMRCDYCYNKEIVFSKNNHYSFNDILKFLKTRVGLLEAVVLSGGEATTHNLVAFAKEIKKLGFLIKLDTNGVNYSSIKELMNLDLLDFIALDYKAPKEKFYAITHSNKYDDFSKTLDFLLQNKIKFEVRTTLHNDLLGEDDINAIVDDLFQRGYKENYYIQKFLDAGENIANLSCATNSFDISKLSNKINLVWR